MPRRAANSRVARGFFPVAGVTLLSEASYGLDKPVLRGANRRTIVPIVLAD
jgi:hypothetical protein